MRGDAALAEHVDVGAEHVFQVLSEAHQVEQAAARLHLHEQVDVAAWLCIASRRRAEDAHVACAMRGGTSQYVRASLTQGIEVPGVEIVLMPTTTFPPGHACVAAGYRMKQASGWPSPGSEP